MQARHWGTIIAILIFLMIITIASGNGDWIGFWGNVVGGIIGALVALAILREEFKRQDKKEKEQFRIHVDLVAAALRRGIKEASKIYRYTDSDKETIRKQVRRGYSIFEKTFHQHQAIIHTNPPVYFALEEMLDAFEQLTEDIETDWGVDVDKTSQEWIKSAQDKVERFDDQTIEPLIELYQVAFDRKPPTENDNEE